MVEDKIIKPDFLIIGGQKCGTTWLWNALSEHPDTDLRIEKEIYFFSSATNYRKGLEWYFSHFQHLNPKKIIGEASTHYYFDRIPTENLASGDSLPPIAKLVQQALPEVKLILILRDPVKRAISAYYHHMRRRHYSPFISIREADQRFPELRIVENGLYGKFLNCWQDFFEPNQMLISLFEDIFLDSPFPFLQKVYSFLGLDNIRIPTNLYDKDNKRWNWTHILLNHYLGAPYNITYRALLKTPLRSLVNRIDLITPPKISDKDIAYLRNAYLAERSILEELLGRTLTVWSYSDN